MQEMFKEAVYLIAAMDLNRCIGRGNKLPWKMPSDFKRFKNITLGHPVIMGRKTYESMGSVPLGGRANIVITKNPQVIDSGRDSLRLLVSPTLTDAIAQGKALDKQVFIIGGQSIYEQAISLADVAYLTIVQAKIADGDAWFPKFTSDWSQVTEASLGGFTQSVKDEYASSLQIWVRHK